MSRVLLSRYQSEEMTISNISFSRVGMEPTTCRFYNHTACATITLSLCTDILYVKIFYKQYL